MSQGTVVVGGHTFTITRLCLRGGALEITAIKHGPMPELADEPATVFGEDGQGCFQGPDNPSAALTLPAAEPHEMASITLAVRWTAMTA